MKAKPIMIQGTGSSVGKSLLVTALCRIFARRGLRVAPFKSQNMSLNSAITAEGHEIGRAQAAQAEAAGVEPTSLMNPVLLKPSGDRTSQVIVNGTVRTTLTAQEYYQYRAGLKPDVLAAYDALAERNDVIVIEGAGSPAEINLRENDLANMGMAELADAPVVLVGDIDKGGVFASLYGTVKLLEPAEQRRIRGFVINKFRGDVSILEPGLRQLEYILGKPFLGVLPYWDVRIDEEDSLSERLADASPRAGAPQTEGPDEDTLDVAVIRLPRLSNYTDFAALDVQPDVALRYVRSCTELGSPDWIILPGTKNTLDDMRYLEESGLAARIRQRHAEGTPVWGVCGGFQMLGKRIRDPDGVESGIGDIAGLGLLPLATLFSSRKRTVRTVMRRYDADRSRSGRAGEEGRPCPGSGLLRGTAGMALRGYEIHMGETSGDIAPFAKGESGRPDGAVAGGGATVGTYLHGLFDNLAFTRTVLNNLRAGKGLAPLPAPEEADFAGFRQREYDRLADMVERHIDMRGMESIIWL